MAAAVLRQVQAPKLLPVSWFLCGPRRCVSSNFKAADLQVQVTREPQKKPGPSQPLLFGKTFTDHMLMVEWTKKTGWSRPRIQPFQNLTLHPACSALHYSLQLFEGLKAYKGKDQQVRLFRPWLNLDRMLRSARRLCLPDFDKQELLECIRRLIEVDKDWVPDSHGSSLYVRPVLIGNEPSLGVGLATQALLYVILCPVGSYFPGDSMTPVSLLADPTFIRAWMGGVGDYKVGGQLLLPETLAPDQLGVVTAFNPSDAEVWSTENYGPTVALQQEAQKKGCEQVLWLYGPDHQLTEVGTMNIFIYWTHKDGYWSWQPPLDGIILPGVVRQSLLDLARTWGEFRVAERKVTMEELKRALEEGRVREVFGSGTACQVCPVHQILYEGKQLHIPTMENGPELILRFHKELKAIQVSSGLATLIMGPAPSSNACGQKHGHFPCFRRLRPLSSNLCGSASEERTSVFMSLGAIGHKNEPPTTPWGHGLPLWRDKPSSQKSLEHSHSCEPRALPEDLWAHFPMSWTRGDWVSWPRVGAEHSIVS